CTVARSIARTSHVQKVRSAHASRSVPAASDSGGSDACSVSWIAGSVCTHTELGGSQLAKRPNAASERTRSPTRLKLEVRTTLDKCPPPSPRFPLLRHDNV